MDGGSNALDGNGLLGGVGLGGLGGLSGLSSMSVNPTALSHQLSGSAMSTATSGQCSGAANSAAGSALSGDYGLLGLLSLIRMTDADRNALALGSDLTMLGLNLNSTENLYSNFASPYSEVPSTKEPHYQVSCFFRNGVVIFLNMRFVY
jgi:CCR4-NOT transcription complex subunit 2